MSHHTKDKGDIGLTKVIADLVEKGLVISLPIHEHLHYDLIADSGKRLIRIQVKYRSHNKDTKSINFNCKTVHKGAKGENIQSFYKKDDFDLYAVYSPELKLCYYIPNVGQAHISIAEQHIQSYTPFYWYEDFLDPLIEKIPEKRIGKSFSWFESPMLNNSKHGKLKVLNRPRFEILKNEIKELGYTGVGRKYGVSDNAVRKWVKRDEKDFVTFL